MKKILNKRLQTLSAFIEKNDVLLDIGCDHGLLGIYLVLNKNIQVISSDINEKPLLKAKENIKKYGLEEKIETRLGDGLSVISNDINTIVISGMGGLNIINILKDIKKYPNVSKLVLSPNSDFPLTRREISKLGFYLNREEMVFENGKYYLISEYQKGKMKTSDFFGKLDLSNITVKNYYQYIYDTNLKIISKLGMRDRVKKKNLIKENDLIKKEILGVK